MLTQCWLSCLLEHCRCYDALDAAQALVSAALVAICEAAHSRIGNHDGAPVDGVRPHVGVIEVLDGTAATPGQQLGDGCSKECERTVSPE